MTEPTELTCKELVELVTDYLEGALSEEDRARFERHLGTCEGCRSYVGQMRTTIRAAGELTEESLPPDQMEKLLDAFRSYRR